MSSNDQSANAPAGETQTPQPDTADPANEIATDDGQSLEPVVAEPGLVVPDDFAIAGLEVQEDMVFWDMLMFLAAVVSILVTGIGVFLLKRTLDETVTVVNETKLATVEMRSANQIAADAQRAWVCIEDFRYDVRKVEGGMHKGGDAKVRIEFKLRNSGRIPVTNLLCNAMLNRSSGDWEKVKDTETAKVAGLRPDQGFCIPPGHTYPQRMTFTVPAESAFHNDIVSMVLGTIVVCYRNGGADEVHNTIQGFQIVGNRDDGTTQVTFKAPSYMT